MDENRNDIYGTQNSGQGQGKGMNTGGPSFKPGIDSMLKEMEYPQDRAGILGHATKGGADKSFLTRLGQIPDTTYNNMEDVRKALGDDYENYGNVDQAAGDVDTSKRARD